MATVSEEKLRAERDEWNRAWHDQRAATGRAYWQGYNDALARARALLQAGQFPYTQADEQEQP